MIYIIHYDDSIVISIVLITTIIDQGKLIIIIDHQGKLV